MRVKPVASLLWLPYYCVIHVSEMSQKSCNWHLIEFVLKQACFPTSFWVVRTGLLFVSQQGSGCLRIYGCCTFIKSFSVTLVVPADIT